MKANSSSQDGLLMAYYRMHVCDRQLLPSPLCRQGRSAQTNDVGFFRLGHLDDDDLNLVELQRHR
jgi:hypothetical protein